MVHSVPKELDSDQADILALARQPGKLGRITEKELVEVGRDKERRVPGEYVNQEWIMLG